MVKFVSVALAVLAGSLASPLLAEEAPMLTIYTYDSFTPDWAPAPRLKAGFEAICGGCIVDWVGVDSSIGTLRRAQLEGESTPADIILGLDTAIAGEARATGLFADHDLTLDNLVLPGGWGDKQFVPFDYSHFAFMYDTDAVPTPPASFEELIALPDDFKIVIQDPRSSTPGFGLVLWVKAAYGDRAAEIWKGLKPHILTVTRDWSESYALFLNGEVDMALSYTSSPSYHLIEDQDDTLKAALFSEGHYPQIEVAGILKSTDQMELARQFLTYLVSPEAQNIIAHTNWMFPVIDLGEALNPAFGNLPQPEKTLVFSDADIAAHGQEWVDEMLAAIR
ncbi:thiamine ABC transporter substrate binding subunit [Devosia sp.]|uniref:thiamine ABC transporter substrate-binding protein n=1 Tax=Devosia sp. TaxID=1871048 RepID=UPI002AFE11E0|nr:thiamine ABC transporter substrate binding subunit [Devosia sp.]